MRSAATTERRRSRRYRPPTGFRPELRRAGLRGYFDGSLCKTCLNISEGGLRVILTRGVPEGSVLRARFGRHEVETRVRYAVPAGAYPGCWEAGLAYVNPAPEFRSWLRESLLRWSAPVLAQRRDAWGEAR